MYEEDYRKIKNYKYVTSFSSCGNTFYDFHRDKDGVVMERLTERQIKHRLNQIENNRLGLIQ